MDTIDVNSEALEARPATPGEEAAAAALIAGLLIGTGLAIYGGCVLTSKAFRKIKSSVNNARARRIIENFTIEEI